MATPATGQAQDQPSIPSMRSPSLRSMTGSLCLAANARCDTERRQGHGFPIHFQEHRLRLAGFIPNLDRAATDGIAAGRYAVASPRRMYRPTLIFRRCLKKTLTRRIDLPKLISSRYDIKSSEEEPATSEPPSDGQLSGARCIGASFSRRPDDRSPSASYPMETAWPQLRRRACRWPLRELGRPSR